MDIVFDGAVQGAWALVLLWSLDVDLGDVGLDNGSIAAYCYLHD